jgi:hypothetical protein
MRMRESILVGYFKGKIGIKKLRRNLHKEDKEDLKEHYEITIADLIKICDAVLHGDLAPSDLQPLGMHMDLCSSKISEPPDDPDPSLWINEDTAEGKRICQVVFEWGCPIINFALTRDNVVLWKQYLQTGEKQHKQPYRPFYTS